MSTISKLLLLPAFCLAPLWSQYGDSQRGAKLLETRNCTQCHSTGGGAPDLSRRSVRDFTPASLAAAFWNHGPRMWQAMAAKDLPVTPLTANEIADLYAHFHSIRYFDARGEASRGKALFTSKKCTNCHNLTPGGENKPGPPVSDWHALANQIQWLENLWNHSGGILAALEKSGNVWPVLTPQEMTDLLVYIRSLPQHRQAKPALVLEDPIIGEQVFAARSCNVCHTVGAKEAGKIDLLASAKSSHSFTDLSVRMWNHLPQMRKQAAWAGIPFPAFSENEMSQILAYLFSKRYFEEKGKPDRGRSVFASKKCGTCHDQQSPGTPDLRQHRGQFSSHSMAAAVWRHGPKMQSQMEKQGLGWPVLTGAQMADLVAYLNAR
jgi:cytochrome c2